MPPASERGKNRGARLLSRAGSHNRRYRRVQQVLARIFIKRRMVTHGDQHWLGSEAEETPNAYDKDGTEAFDVNSFFTRTLANRRQP